MKQFFFNTVHFNLASGIKRSERARNHTILKVRVNKSQKGDLNVGLLVSYIRQSNNINLEDNIFLRFQKIYDIHLIHKPVR